MKHAQSLLHIVFISITFITSIESYYGTINIAPECREKLAGLSTAQQDTLMVVYDYDIISLYKECPDVHQCFSRVHDSYKPGRSLSDTDVYSSFAMPATQPIALFKSKHGILGFLNGVLSFTFSLFSRFTGAFGIDIISFIPLLLKTIDNWKHNNNKLDFEWARITGSLADVYRSWDCETFRKYFDERIYFSEETEDLEILLNTYGLWEFGGFCDFIAGVDSRRCLSIDKMLYPYLKKIIDKMSTREFHQNMRRAGDLGDIVQTNIPRIYEIIKGRLESWQQLPEQIENERAKNQQKKELQNRIDTMFDAACCSTIRQSLIDARTLFPDDQERIDARLAALEKRESCDYTTQTYTLLPEVANLLRIYNINSNYYTTFTGIPFAHVLHKEAIQLLQDVATATHLDNDFTESLIDLVDTSVQYNRKLNYSAAMKVIDYALALVDLIPVQLEAFGNYLTDDSPESIKTIANNDYVQGIVLGLYGSLGNTCRIFRHPIDSTADVGKMIAKAGFYLAAILAEIHAVEDGLQRNTPIIDSVCNMTMALIDHAHKQPFKEKLKFVTTIASDTLLTPRLLARLANMGRSVLKKCAQLQEVLQDAQRAQEVALAADIPCTLAQAEVIAQGEKELALMSKMSQTPHSTPPVTLPAPTPTPPTKSSLGVLVGPVADAKAFKLMNTVADDIRKFDPMASVRFARKYYDLVTKVGDDAIKLFGHHTLRYMAKAEAEAAALVQMFRNKFPKGYDVLQKYTIMIDPKHLFFLDIKTKDVRNLFSKFSGFHHDCMGMLESSGMIELVDKVSGKLGTYRAKIRWNGYESPLKSFFPQNWTRDHVIEKVLEAFEHCRQNNTALKVLSNGDYKLISITSEGIEIEMIISKTGQIITAYPLVP